MFAGVRTIFVLPKAPPRQNKKKSEPGCSRVYPDTPEKDNIEQKEEQKQLKEENKLREVKKGSEPACEAPALKSDVKKRKKAFKQKNNRILKKKTKARGKQTNWLSSSEESDDSKIAGKAQTSDSDICLSETDHEEEQLAYLKPDTTLQPGDYVLVKFPTRNTRNIILANSFPTIPLQMNTFREIMDLFYRTYWTSLW
ncbi:hypothetical protein QE152_g13265 [Popillia japonica]|uniref:Uncharacterized protein n=1 Tax=Popillia japonica TaxID=7064 RepID=A0AAW1LA25_POPJA